MKKPFYYIFIAGVLLFSCGAKETLTLGSLNTPYALTVSEIYAGVLEKAGYKVIRSYGFDGIETLHAAILNGGVDIGTEWTGEALTKVLGAPRSGDQYGTYDALSARYVKLGLVLLEPLPADNHWTLAVLQENPNSAGIKTFSDVKNRAPELVIAVTSGFNDDREAFPLLEEVYGTFGFKEIELVPEEEQYALLRSRAVDVIALRANDGHFADAGYRALRDNFHAFIPQNLVPVVKDEFLSSHAGIRQALNAVSASLNDKVMIDLNNRTAVKKEPYRETAKSYLETRR
ncbi:MAG: hypothetical protein LBO04_08245 [Spirochaetaceae bacterium]|jgi:glycine betaine/choline ABC-type transport system substrate-binding protein|nr:hypothetical protein [Spirochaetaceae bacterium]